MIICLRFVNVVIDCGHRRNMEYMTKRRTVNLASHCVTRESDYRFVQATTYGIKQSDIELRCAVHELCLFVIHLLIDISGVAFVDRLID